MATRSAPSVRQQGYTERQANRQDYAGDHWDDDHWHDDDFDLGDAVVAGAVVAGTAAVVGAAVSSASTPSYTTYNYYNTLPCTLTTVVVNGVSYYRCGATWYNSGVLGRQRHLCDRYAASGVLAYRRICTMGLARVAAVLVLGLAPVPLAAGSPGEGPAGMVFIPGGEFDMGSGEPVFRDAHPVHRVAVDAFWIDVTEITNAQFAEFVRVTGYRTVAERVPRAEDYPGALPDMLFAGSVVFSPPEHEVPLDNHFRWWSYVRGADWRHPEGAASSIEGRLDHPVVHIAYEDAEAYAKWAGKRLPTEAEWEHAARGGLNGKKFVWGDSFRPTGQAMANTFQGHFPDRNTGEDGYLATSPVMVFAPNGYGIYGVAGNVWEWTADWYRPDTHARDARGGAIVRNPTGPREEESFDPSEPGVRKRVHKGGSFLCTDQYCARYMPGARGKGAPDTGTNHLGFRCVMTAETWKRSRQARSPGSK